MSRHAVAELQRIGFDGFLSYHFYSEPLLRRDLEELVEHARERLPDAYQLLYTNGDLLSENRYRDLINAGIDHFIVTQHDNDVFPERPYQTVVMGNELQLTNRGGYMEDVEVLEGSLSAPCHAPTDMLLITYNGDVLLCCDDAERQNVMGNIMESPIEEIWFSPQFQQLRDLLAQGKRAEAGGICSRCNNMEYVRQGENYYTYIRRKAKG